MQQVADIASVPSIDQLNIKIRKSLKGHNAKVVADTLPKQRPSNSNCKCCGGINNAQWMEPGARTPM